MNVSPGGDAGVAEVEASGEAGGFRIHAPSLPEAQREQALARWQVLRAHLEDGCPLVRVAAEHDVPERTLRRWLAVL